MAEEQEKVSKRGVNLRPSAWEALRRLAFEERTTVSEQVRRAVKKYLARRAPGRQATKRAAVRRPA